MTAEGCPHTDAPAPAQPADGLEELVLELRAPRMEAPDGVRRATAQARLLWRDASGTEAPPVDLAWPLIAPVAVEAELLDWYLRRFALWPGRLARQRAGAVEGALQAWGRRLAEAALPAGLEPGALLRSRLAAGARLCIRVVEEAGAQADAGAREACARLLGLPWELLHDGERFLFLEPAAGSLRRGLQTADAPLSQLPQSPQPPAAGPLRVLSVAARPQGVAGRPGDQLAGTRALVQAMEALAGALELRVLASPTWPALREELERARRGGRPWQVLHLDAAWLRDPGSGVHSLCLEAPGDTPQALAVQPVPEALLGALLRGQGVALAWLEAPAGTAPEGLAAPAAALLRAGVGAVVAMRHGLMPRSARAFAESFMGALCRGDAVADALRTGRLALRAEAGPGGRYGDGGEAGQGPGLDGFVPMLFQQPTELRLCAGAGAPGSLRDPWAELRQRLGAVPAEPAGGFVGRGSELLRLQGLLQAGRLAVLCGPAGGGRTALAAECASWLLRSGQVDRAAFVSLAVHDSAAEVLERLGRQLVPDFDPALYGDATQARQAVEAVLAQAPTLLVLDHLEALQPPPLQRAALPGAMVEAATRERDAVLALCRRLLRQPGTRLLLSGREAPPAPFDDPRQRLALQGLDADAALLRLARMLEAVEGGVALEAPREAVEALVEATRGHPGLLGGLAPSLRQWGAQAARTRVLHQWALMEERFPAGGDTAQLAGLALALERLPAELLDRARVLGLFHGGVHPEVLQSMLGWTAEEVAALLDALCEAELAAPGPYGQVLPVDGLAPLLRSQLDAAERELLLPLWGAALSDHGGALLRQQQEQPARAAALTRLALPDWLALLDLAERAAPAEGVADVANLLVALLRPLDRPGLLAQVLHRRDVALARASEGWNAARAGAVTAQAASSVMDGSAAAQAGADCARIEALCGAGRVDEALAALDAARRGFEQLGDVRAAAAAGYQAGLVHLKAGRPTEAESAWREALALQTRLGDALGQALTLNQLGVLYDERLGRVEEALACFRQGARCAERCGDAAAQSLLRTNAADSLRRLGRWDEARAEAHRALEGAAGAGAAAQPWTIWALRSSIEQGVGDTVATAQARREAVTSYLAYRRAGGEPRDGHGRLGDAVGQALRAGDRAQAEAVLQALAADPALPAQDRVFVRRLQVIVSGSRDPTLADAPELPCTAAAEIVLLLEGLER
jgi:tetratricopeptide (TPR) repeat protein